MVAVVSNIIGLSFDSIASTRIRVLTDAMTAILDAEKDEMLPIIRAVFIMFIGRQFYLTMMGHMMMERFFGSITRALIILLLLVHSNQFVVHIEIPVFTTIPQALSNIVLEAEDIDTTNTDSVAVQFDHAAAGADAVVALIGSKNQGWAISDLVNSMTVFIDDIFFQIFLVIMVFVWLLGQTFLAIIICFGPVVLIFELFDRTRGWVDQYIGKIVGMICFGFGTSILLGIELQGLNELLKSANDNIPDDGAEAVAIMGHILVDCVLDAFTMVALPLICSIGSGVAGSLAAPSALAMRSALRGGLGAARMAVRSSGGRPPNNNIS